MEIHVRGGEIGGGGKTGDSPVAVPQYLVGCYWVCWESPRAQIM